MTPLEIEAVRTTVESLTRRAVDAEIREARVAIERDQLRALLIRLRTSLAEATSLQEIGK